MVEKQVSARVREALERKVEEHNEKYGDSKTKRANLRMLEAVFRRGVGAYRTNPPSRADRPTVTGADQWAYARVNSFLYVLRTGRFRGGKFDQDLLPKGHPQSTKKAVTKASYKPTQGMVASAKRGLEMRREFGRGGTAVGVARARDIANGKELSEDTVLRMHSFFSRHAVDAQAEGFERGEKGYPSAGRVAHELWGGDSGRTWAEKYRNQIMRQRSEKEMYEYDKARNAMDHLLMAYSSMMSYRFEGAHELRAKTMEIIHGLEHHLMENPNQSMEVEKPYHDDEEEKGYEDYSKEIVMEDGQYCVRSKDGTRNFGCYISQERAEERLQQIESFARMLKEMEIEDLELAYEATTKALKNDPTNLVKQLTSEEIFARLSHPTAKQASTDVSLTTVLKAEQRYTMGPVYVPNFEDAHGETIEADELQKAIWDWVRKGDRRIFLQHSDKVAGEMVEILTWPMPIETSLMVPNEGVTKYQFPADTPFMGVIWEDWAWNLVKAGELRGYSIGGQASRIEVELPDEVSV
jgi:hypothetical protein